MINHPAEICFFNERFKKISLPNPLNVIGNFKGGGGGGGGGGVRVSKANTFKGKYEAKLEISGVGVITKKHSTYDLFKYDLFWMISKLI